MEYSKMISTACERRRPDGALILCARRAHYIPSGIVADPGTHDVPYRLKKWDN
jgi:hypothetical protein